MQHEDVRRAAEHISVARIEGTRMSALPESVRPQSEADAYRVQAELHNIMAANQRGQVVGYKIGCTTPVMQEFLGIRNPCAGALYRPALHFREAMLKHGEYLHPGVEAEVAVYLGSDISAREASNGRHDRDSVGGAVQAVFAAIEIVDDRWEDYTAIGTPSLIADDFFGAGCVLGEPVASWRELDLGHLEGEMRVNGKVAGTGSTGDILGHPLEALAWLANLVTSRGESLRRGQIVMLGSVVQTNWVERMDEVEVEIEGLGKVTAWFG
ncbi:MAG: fumarylacetoacetate hydrolase family protein [Chloroflexi bacterium]|nr:fumarylacetoacetate hydrolase family protein [Chloroflexota bacterium]MDA1297600.1 fumarylacetoacetate hydrolase family protein [Chloroflexota bacterium]